MRFLIGVVALCLVLVTPALGGSHEPANKDTTEAEPEEGLSFEYEYGMSFSDGNLGRETDDDEDIDVKSIENYMEAVGKFDRTWKDLLGLKIDFNFTAEKLTDGLEVAMVTAVLPRSYLSVAVGKTELHFGGTSGVTEFYFAGTRSHSSPYLDYHNPFPRYGAMVNIFAPLEGIGELSLMLINDVKGDDWNNQNEAATGILQFKGNFHENLSPVLQFVPYDFDEEDKWYHSWAGTVGAKIDYQNLTLELNYTRDNRDNGGKDMDGATVYNNYVADLSYKHGMVSTDVEFSIFMTEAVDNDAADGVEGNTDPSVEGYADLSDAKKFNTNMMTLRLGINVHCINDKFVPFISYRMWSHQIDPNPAEEDSDLSTQVSHGVTLGVWGVI